MKDKNYLSRQERDNFLLSLELTTHISNVLNKWEKNLTGEEKRRIKSSITNIDKALASIADRLPSHEAKKIMKAAKDFQVRVLSVEGAKALEKNSKDKYFKNLSISFEEMEAIATQILTNNCYYCKLKCNECDYYEMLMRFLVPGCNAEINCPYAYTDDSKFKVKEVEDMTDLEIYRECLKRQKIKVEIKQEIEKEKARKAKKVKITENPKEVSRSKPIKQDHKLSKRKQKKLKNRFDEDEIKYSYKTKNFK